MKKSIAARGEREKEEERGGCVYVAGGGMRREREEGREREMEYLHDLFNVQQESETTERTIL